MENFSEFIGLIEKKDEEGNIYFTFTVEEKHLNGHGTASGGALFSICSEAVADYVKDAEGRDGVGAEGSIHYYRPAMPGDVLRISVLPRKTGKRMSNYLIEVRKCAADSSVPNHSVSNHSASNHSFVNSPEEVLIADAVFTVAHPM